MIRPTTFYDTFMNQLSNSLADIQCNLDIHCKVRMGCDASKLYKYNSISTTSSSIMSSVSLVSYFLSDNSIKLSSTSSLAYFHNELKKKRQHACILELTIIG